jgi:translation initiation factor 2B subunit (eIF-2B alpha/beta/delta family)
MIKIEDIIESCSLETAEVLQEVIEQEQEQELEKFIDETLAGASMNNIIAFVENEIEFILDEVIELENRGGALIC